MKRKPWKLIAVASGLSSLLMGQSAIGSEPGSGSPVAIRRSQEQPAPTALEEASHLYRQGILHYQQSNFPTAIAALQRSLTIREELLGTNHADVAASLDGLAVVCGVQGRHEEAEQLHLRALHIREAQLGRTHPEVALSLDGLAWLYQEQRRYDEAIAAIDRALEILPDGDRLLADKCVLLTYRRGVIYQERGNPALAVSNYEVALALDDRYWPAMVNLGLLAYEWGAIAEALDRWRTVLVISENAAKPKLALAVALYQQGPRAEWIELGIAALQQDGDYSNIGSPVRNL